MQTSTLWRYSTGTSPNFSRNSSGVLQKVAVGVQNLKLNISETVKDRAKVTINCRYKVTHDLSIGAKMYDLE